MIYHPTSNPLKCPHDFSSFIFWSKFSIFFIVGVAEEKNTKLQSELRRMDRDFENELKERETIVNELKNIESKKKGM